MKRIALALTVLTLTTGCEKIQEKLAQKAAEKIVETSTGGDVKIDTNTGTVSVKDGKQGVVAQSGPNAKVPDGWPASVPVYPGAAVLTSLSTPQGKTMTLQTKDAPEKVAAFYKDKLSKLPKLAEAAFGTATILSYKDGANTISINVTAQPGEPTTLQLAVTAG